MEAVDGQDHNDNNAPRSRLEWPILSNRLWTVFTGLVCNAFTGASRIFGSYWSAYFPFRIFAACSSQLEASPNLLEASGENVSAADAEDLHSVYPLEHKPLTRGNILECLSTAPKMPQPGSGCIIARIRSDVVVKYGWERVHLNEANTMRLARQRTSVALPEVLDAWTATAPIQTTRQEAEGGRLRRNGPVTYIVLRYVPGTVLHHKWPLMSEAERKLLVRRVADMLRELQTVEMDRPGPVGDPPIRCEGFHFTDYKAGPFSTKDDVERWLNNRLHVCKLFRNVPEDRPNLVIERLVLCHMDPHEHNIIVAEDGRPWLVDWGLAGGYPPGFERGSIMKRTEHFAKILGEELYDEKDESFLARLKEMTFAFTTGAMCERDGPRQNVFPLHVPTSPPKQFIDA